MKQEADGRRDPRVRVYRIGGQRSLPPILWLPLFLLLLVVLPILLLTAGALVAGVGLVLALAGGAAVSVARLFGVGKGLHQAPQPDLHATGLEGFDNESELPKETPRRLVSQSDTIIDVEEIAPQPGDGEGN